MIDTVIVSHQGPQIHYNIRLHGICFLNIGIQQPSVDRPFCSDKQNKIAAGLVGNFPEFVDANVLKEYDRVKRMQYIRYRRTCPDKNTSIIDISLLEYWGWLTKASEALAAYLAGKLSEKEAMAIIYVPTKDELLEQISSELTLETAAM